MPYDQKLAARLTELVAGRPDISEKRMFGGFGYMLNGNMCMGIHKEFLVLRLGLKRAETILDDPGVKPMDFTGKVMKGWVMVEPEGYADDDTVKRVILTSPSNLSTHCPNKSPERNNSIRLSSAISQGSQRIPSATLIAINE